MNQRERNSGVRDDPLKFTGLRAQAKLCRETLTILNVRFFHFFLTNPTPIMITDARC